MAPNTLGKVFMQKKEEQMTRGNSVKIAKFVIVNCEIY